MLFVCLTLVTPYEKDEPFLEHNSAFFSPRYYKKESQNFLDPDLANSEYKKGFKNKDLG